MSQTSGTGNIFLAILGGLAAAIVGALIWMGVTVATDMHIGYVALGVGALVGFAVRFAGQGSTPVFGIIGALLTLLGCLGGEILTVAQFASSPEISFFSALTSLNLGEVVPNIISRMDPIMYLIYGIGIYEGYKFSIKK